MLLLHVTTGDGSHAVFVVLLTIGAFALGFGASSGFLDVRQALGGVIGLVAALVVLAVAV